MFSAKNHNKELPITIYFIMTIICILLWVPFHDLCHLAGAVSIIYSFLFAVGIHNQFFRYIALVWGPLLMLSLIISYIIAAKRRKYLPFLVVAGTDLTVLVLLIGYKLLRSNYVGLLPMSLSCSAHIIYFFWMIRHFRNT